VHKTLHHLLNETRPSVSSSPELDRYHQTLQRLQQRLVEGARCDRIKPPVNLALTQVSFEDGTCAPGEILDLSPEGMKVALDAGYPVAVDQACRLRVGGPLSDEHFELAGTVRWVESCSFITVFGIRLDRAELRGPQHPPG